MQIYLDGLTFISGEATLTFASYQTQGKWCNFHFYTSSSCAPGYKLYILPDPEVIFPDKERDPVIEVNGEGKVYRVLTHEPFRLFLYYISPSEEKGCLYLNPINIAVSVVPL